MINEPNSEKNTLIKTKNSLLVSENINILALYRFFINYLKRQKVVAIFTLIIIPLAILFQSFFNGIRGFYDLKLGITFIAIGSAISIYVIVGFLLDLKMSVIYKRIGLLGIKPFGFILISLFYCLTLVIITDLLVLITSLIITASLKLNFASVFSIITLLGFLLSIFSTIFVTCLILIFVVLVHSRSMQTLISTIFSLIFVGGAFIMVVFIPMAFASSYATVITSPLGLGIYFSIIGGLILLSALSIWINLRIFKWDN
ncbi:hypothetical protein [Spiroplasma chrysopicola]|uniref:ABC-2 type transporter domain-containing protein n=1 Tax=Spiroplasma chrysopicola DF-1 TaxID=1276227 RepID=R4UG12_9MOLU|nr:hypothetical protein [Spiroplasma chrysopicola]AGM25085.1 hypothetical protein SCHRY_v1c05070 [Spiroplasma chrysopicola DF-1]